jgi:hypothetical protein
VKERTLGSSCSFTCDARKFRALAEHNMVRSKKVTTNESAEG